MKLAVSTAAFRRESVEWILEVAERERFVIEFSSGLSYRPDMEAVYLNAGVRRLLHNYFPAPADPFVLNLASLDPGIAKRSMAHCMQGLRLAAMSKAPFYSAHAGFCVDPGPTDLGAKFRSEMGGKREEHWARFIANVQSLVDCAEQLSVDFLVENNVCIEENVLADGKSPLLCTDAEENIALIEAVGRPRLRLLLDTGHLAVSAASMRFSKEEFLRTVGPFIGAIHHSDNDCHRDSNDAVARDYWFLEHMPKFETSWHILEVTDQSPAQVHEQHRLLAEAMHVTRRSS